jgi:hypothetical protein
LAEILFRLAPNGEDLPISYLPNKRRGKGRAREQREKSAGLGKNGGFSFIASRLFLLYFCIRHKKAPPMRGHKLGFLTPETKS